MKSTGRAVVYLLLVFLLGVAGGVVGSMWAARQGWLPGASGHRHFTKEGAVRWLTEELNLTPEQQRQLEAILDETGRGYEAIRERTRPEYDRIRQEGREKIRAILTAEQRARFEELVRRIDEERARRRQRYETKPGGEQR
ncbi:MAG: hypothetical protein HYY26_01250 [Acidobacteria bacterium]|nr:hypothetical protein [Acidobacteriota bacterium]